jgi:hypothetical protein
MRLYRVICIISFFYLLSVIENLIQCFQFTFHNEGDIFLLWEILLSFLNIILKFMLNFNIIS